MKKEINQGKKVEEAQRRADAKHGSSLKALDVGKRVGHEKERQGGKAGGQSRVNHAGLQSIHWVRRSHREVQI